MSALTRIFPEVGAGGFSHVDGTVEFYLRVRALTTPESIVVDLGAGRGAFAEDKVAVRRDLHMLRGNVQRVIGLDVDPVVLTNPTLDAAHVIEPGSPFPLEPTSVDLVVSDFTFEHVAEPAQFTKEIDRVLKPGGWVCARTPNKWGYIGIGARIVPNSLHTGLGRKLQPNKEPEDYFPVQYRLNTRRLLRRHFPEGRFENFTYGMNNEPAYFADSLLAWQIQRMLERALPRGLSSVLYVFLRKRLDAT